MLDPEKAGAWLEHHFATVTPEEFIANVRRSDPEFAQEMWGDLSVAEILARRDQSPREGGDLADSHSAAGPCGSGEGAMIDPQTARAVLKEYYATETDQQIVDDLWRHSPGLARRLGVAPPVSQAMPVRRKPRGMRGLFAAFGRSVLRLFS